MFNQPPKGPYFTRLRQKGNSVYPRRGPQFRTAVRSGGSSVARLGARLQSMRKALGLIPKLHTNWTRWLRPGIPALWQRLGLRGTRPSLGLYWVEASFGGERPYLEKEVDQENEEEGVGES